MNFLTIHFSIKNVKFTIEMNEHCVKFIKDDLFAIIFQKITFIKFGHFFEFSQNDKISKKVQKIPG